jgi:hypothetical protein
MSLPVGNLARNLRHVQQFIFILLVIAAVFSFLESNPAPQISPIAAGCAIAVLIVSTYAIFLHPRMLLARIGAEHVALQHVKATTATGDVIAQQLLALQGAVKNQQAPDAVRVTQDLEQLIE